MLVITASYLSRRSLWGKLFWKKGLESLTFFRNWAAKFWSLTGSFRQCWKNYNLPVSINDLRKITFPKIFFSIYFPIVSKAIPAFWWKTSSRVVIYSFYLSRVTFWHLINLMKNFFIFMITPGFEEKIFGTLAKTFRQGCEFFFLSFRKKVLGKKISW